MRPATPGEREIDVELRYAVLVAAAARGTITEETFARREAALGDFPGYDRIVEPVWPRERRRERVRAAFRRGRPIRV
jgi:hypothetical protein